MRFSSLWLEWLVRDESGSSLGSSIITDSDPVNPARDALRALLILALFALTFSAAMLATVFRGEWARGKVTSFVAMVGGGVFLSTCLLDILPDAVESLEKADMQSEFPFAEAAVGLGFVLVLSIEQIVLHLQEKGILGSPHLRLHDHEPAPETLSHHSHSHDSHEHSYDENPALSAILLVVALSLHALFEGLSLAVIADPSKLLEVFLALIIHKCIIGFSLGVRLVQCELRPLVIVVCALIFSAQVVVGGLGGISIMHALSGGSAKTAAFVTCILQGIACGTFLYITTFEVLPHELEKPGLRIWKLGALALGCAIVIGFMLIFPETA